MKTIRKHTLDYAEKLLWFNGFLKSSKINDRL
jgi:hypothetical protein